MWMCPAHNTVLIEEYRCEDGKTEFSASLLGRQYAFRCSFAPHQLSMLLIAASHLLIYGPKTSSRLSIVLLANGMVGLTHEVNALTNGVVPFLVAAFVLLLLL